jgi:hypothetical protein
MDLAPDLARACLQTAHSKKITGIRQRAAGLILVDPGGVAGQRALSPPLAAVWCCRITHGAEQPRGTVWRIPGSPRHAICFNGTKPSVSTTLLLRWESA